METFSLTSQNSTQKEFASRTSGWTWREPFLYVSVCVCECVCECVCVTSYANIIPIHVLQLYIVYYVHNIFTYLEYKGYSHSKIKTSFPKYFEIDSCSAFFSADTARASGQDVCVCTGKSISSEIFDVFGGVHRVFIFEKVTG